MDHDDNVDCLRNIGKAGLTMTTCRCVCGNKFRYSLFDSELMQPFECKLFRTVC